MTLTTRHLKKGQKIVRPVSACRNFRKRAAPMGGNPTTGEAIKFKANKKAAFRPSKELKEAV